MARAASLLSGQAYLSLDETASRFPTRKSSASESCNSRCSANQFFILGRTQNGKGPGSVTLPQAVQSPS